MNKYVTGETIKKLREEKNITQSELADILFLSPKTISKWETGNGLPDISVIDSLAKALNVSIGELFSGEKIINTNTHANMLNTKIYVCPICGNCSFSIGENLIYCHGIKLYPLEAEDVTIDTEVVEDEVYVNIPSPMTRDDYISFIVGFYCDKIEFKKLYIEGPAEARLNIRGLKYIYYYNNRNGLFRYKYKKIK